MAEGRGYPVASAQLTQHLVTERWDAASGSWRYGADQLRVHLGLELSVDERSGDDGELAPDLRIEARALPCPLLTELVGQRLDRLGTSSGWFGNDAPVLEGIEVTLAAIPEPGTAELRVAASYRWQPDRPPRTFAFAGPVLLAPLWFQVKDPADAPPFLERAFGRAGADALSLEEGGTIEASGAAPDRRRWFRYRADPR